MARGRIKIMDEKLEQAKVSLNNANVIDDIKSNPVVDSVLMAVVKEIPVIGNMIDLSMKKVIADFQQKKEQELIEIILKDKNTITPDMVNDVEFLFSFTKVEEAVRKLATNDKVQYFGNLIRNGYLSGEHIENSEFEEYLEMLKMMSYREIQWLVRYKRFCNEQHEKRRDGNDWQEFLYTYLDGKEFEEQERLSYIIPKLVRTGFVEEVYEIEQTETNLEDEPVMMGSGVRKVGYRLTPSFNRFYEMVLRMEE